MSQMDLNEHVKDNVKETICMLDKPDTKPTTTGQQTQNQTYDPHRQLWLLNTVFFLMFNSYGCTERLQSTLNAKDGLGLYSLSVLYGSTIFTSVTLAPVILHKLTTKWSLMLAWCVHIIFIVSNFYPSWWTLLPASALLGCATGVVWTCQGVYISEFSMESARRSGDTNTAVLSRYYGYFQMVMALTGIGGNLFSSLLFSYTSTHGNNVTYKEILFVNQSFSNVSTELLDNNLTYREPICGASFCLRDYDLFQEETGIQEVPPMTRYILMSVLLMVELIGLVMSGFLINLTFHTDETSTCAKFVSSWKLIVNFKYLLASSLFLVKGTSESLLLGLYLKVRF